jgi:hypothetical protein
MKLSSHILLLCLATPVLSFQKAGPIPRDQKRFSSSFCHRIHRAPGILRALKSESEVAKSSGQETRDTWPIKIDSNQANYVVEKIFTGGTVSQFTFLLFLATFFVSGGALLIWLAAFGESSLQYAVSKSYMLLFRYGLLPALQYLKKLKAAAGFLATAPWPRRHHWSP